MSKQTMHNICRMQGHRYSYRTRCPYCSNKTAIMTEESWRCTRCESGGRLAELEAIVEAAYEEKFSARLMSERRGVPMGG